jgi:hypothetical protein
VAWLRVATAAVALALLFGLTMVIALVLFTDARDESADLSADEYNKTRRVPRTEQ